MAAVDEQPSQTILLKNRAHRSFKSQPVTYGVPWPEGTVVSVDELAALDENGNEIPAAFTVLNDWSDGSLQWTLLDTALDLEPSAKRKITIEKRPGSRPSPDMPAHAKADARAGSVGNGLVEISVSAISGEFLTEWTISGRSLIEDNGLDVTFRGEDAKSYSVSAGPREITVEHANPLRAVLRVDGKHASSDGSELLDYFIRFEVSAGRPDVKITYSFRNRELPTPGIEISSLYAELKTTAPSGAKRCFTASNLGRHYLDTFMRIDGDPQIIASDTGDLDNYEETHKDGERADCFVRDPDVLNDPPETKPWFLQNPKYRLQAGGNKCVWPYLALASGGGGVLGFFSQMTSLHPKELTTGGSTMRFGIRPDWAGPLGITQGAGRSHVFFVVPVTAGADDMEIQTQYLSREFGGVSTHTPSLSAVTISPDVDHVRTCRVFAIDKLPPHRPEENLLFERKILDAWMGMRHGELGSTDEIQPPPGSGLWNYGDGNNNNEEMHALPFFQNHLRSGSWACAEVGVACATHIMEVDHVAFSVDAYQNGGMVSHCLNHNDGAVYPSHMWFTELLFAYALTGDTEYRKAAISMCENLLFWIDDDEGFNIITADEREAGQPMINLTWCYHFNRDRRYLDGCMKIIKGFHMANADRYGRTLCPEPKAMPVKIASYGDYASWEGMYWYWEITRDEKVKDFLLGQFEWKVTPERSGVHGFYRTTDYNPAAYAYYMTGDENWIRRVARPFRGAFKSARWALGWIHSMYYIKLALDLGVVTDEDVCPQ